MSGAKAEVISVNVVGRGTDHNIAVLDGLKQAVAQVTGMVIDVKSLNSISEGIVDVVGSDGNSNYSKLSQSAQSDIASRINGYISSYNILSSEKNEDNLYVVDMVVDIEKYTSPGAENNRYKLAIVGVSSNGGMCFGNRLSASFVNDGITDALVSSFTATRKFSVLDRNENLAYDLEKQLIESDDALISEQVKLRNVVGADYIITGNVKDVNIWQNVQTIALTGEKLYSFGAKATFDYKLMVFATRQVKVSSSVSVSLNSNEISGKDCSEIFAMLMNKIAKKISNDCIENIYPLRIVNVKGKNVYVNMGGDAVNVGEVYGIYDTGEDLIDPYTGESLGAEEERIGMIKITVVKPKYSVGEVIEGNINSIGVNQICRKEIINKPKVVVKKNISHQQKAPDYSLPL